MSELLDPVACLDPQRKADLARNDALMRTAYGIRVTGPAKMSGSHLSEAPNDPAGYIDAPLTFSDIEAEANRLVQAVMRQPLGGGIAS